MSNNVISHVENKFLECIKDKWQFQNFKFKGHQLHPLERKRYFDFGVLEICLNPNGSIDIVGDFYRNSIKPKEYTSAQEACAKIYDHLRYADQNYVRLMEAPEDWAQQGLFSKLLSGLRKAS